MDSHRRIEQAAADWLARRSDAARPWTDDDQAALEAWLSASTAHQVAWIRLETIWRQADRLKALGAGVPAGTVPDKTQWRQTPFFTHRGIGTAAMSVAHASTAGASEPADAHNVAALQFRSRHARPARHWGLRLAGAVASVLLVAALSLGGWRWYASPVGQAEFRTAFGDVQEVLLPDGSIATLSSDTQLRATLLRRARDIELQRGEAYFQVVSDSRRPFTVRIGDTRVTAVGTRFSVRGEVDADAAVRVVVTEGTVRLDTGGPSQPAARSALLTAGAVATVHGGTVRVDSHSPEQAEQVLGWRSGELVFDATPLAEAAAEFNRYNARRIVIEDPALAQMRVDGGFRTSNVDGFVRLLEVAFDVRAERRDDSIVLRPR